MYNITHMHRVHFVLLTFVFPSSKRDGKRVAFFPQQFLNTLTDEMDVCVCWGVLCSFSIPLPTDRRARAYLYVCVVIPTS